MFEVLVFFSSHFAYNCFSSFAEDPLSHVDAKSALLKARKNKPSTQAVDWLLQTTLFVRIAERCCVSSLAVTSLMWLAMYLQEWCTETRGLKGTSSQLKFTKNKQKPKHLTKKTFSTSSTFAMNI